MESLSKIATLQDSFWVDLDFEHNNHEDTLKLNRNIFALIGNPTGGSFLNFKLYKEDFIKCACAIIKRLGDLERKHPTKKYEYDIDFFTTYLSSIDEFFGSAADKIYQVKVRDDNRFLLGFSKVGNFSPRCYIMINSTQIVFIKNDDGSLSLRLYPITKLNAAVEVKSLDSELQNVYQKVFYGAPGTGKSHKINSYKAITNINCLRTTFHPDTDYASFVGCYKPISKSEKQRFEAASYTKEELHDMYVSFKPTASSRPEICFASMYFKQMQPLSQSDRAYIVGLTVGDPMLGELTKGFAAGEAFADTYLSTKKEITYEFTPQVFTNAYVEAWKKHAEGKPVFLIIEEINRGNCAQIFGDLFQLLDRDDDGYSKYEIRPDSDLENYINEQKLNIANIVNTNGVDISEDLNNGKLLKLPKNLVILATMNTSDQSLFPMDSAFKRRWDWEYVPIDYKDASQFSIALSDKKNWSDFLQSINAKISKDLHSSAKQLGNRFVNPSDKIITTDMFINKVLFYLFNDAYKDDEDFAKYFFGQDAREDAKLFEDIYADTASKDTLCKNFIEKLIKDFPPKIKSEDVISESDDKKDTEEVEELKLEAE